MAKYNPVYPFEHLHGKYAKGKNISYRETLGVNHTYVLQHPYEGPASEAQNVMRRAMGAATQYASIILRDPAIKAEWAARCESTSYRRPDRYCISEYYKIFKSDTDQLNAALEVIAADKQRKLQQQVAKNVAQAQAQEQIRLQQNQSPIAILQRQVDLMAARIAELEQQLKSK